jgi:hypothetical protein
LYWGYVFGDWLRGKRRLGEVLFVVCILAAALLTLLTYGLSVSFAIGMALGYSGLINTGRHPGRGFATPGAVLHRLKQAGQTDPVWNEANLLDMARQTFLRFQSDWMHFDVNAMKSYMTPKYLAHIQLMLLAMQSMGRQNVMQDVAIHDIDIKNFVDEPDTNQDRVSVRVSAQATDKLVDTATNTNFYTDKSPFVETYNFQRSGDNNWLLDSIDEETADLSRERGSVVTFAAKNGLFYSLDWGRLLLPQRGQLFSGAKFSGSDINNHTIGLYHGVIIQLYTYAPDAKASRDSYAIAQLTIPKSYGGIIVKAKTRTLIKRTPRGYNHITSEWNDFNTRYDLYATDSDQATTFELLHPVYMERLYALPFKVSIEVVDNVIYLYSDDKRADYGTMLELLHAAFEELKL